MSAAHQMLRTARRTGRTLEVTVLEAGQFTSYSACGIPYLVSGEVDELDDLVARTPEQHRAAGIDLRTGQRVTRLDLDARVAEVEGGDDVAFDQVVVATGACPRMPQWTRLPDGAPVGGVRPASTLEDARAWAQELAPGERVVVAGGGYIGVEMVEAAVRRGLQVTLVTRSRVLSTFAPEVGAEVARGMREVGVEVVEHAAVTDLEVEDGRVAAVRLRERSVPTDHVVVALGVVPATDLLAHTDLLSERGTLRPDETGRVAPGVWAAGDCCEVRTRDGAWTYAPLGTHANKAGRALGDQVAGGDLTFPGVLGTAITRFAVGEVHLEVARTGILDHQVAAPVDPVTVVTRGTTASGYMPEAAPITIRVSADRVSRRLLSVEVAGGPGAGKRVDAAAAVLWLRGSVDDLAWMDLAYAPPVATAWEVLQIAARRVAELIDQPG
ncbi:FAD-dependent oxidoreductase [Nocardioides sp. Y6]|uniref:FAD-dependent oxidoreductase n=2 Tax=Nocardioides malaquae TaxID=2773426 RepID=A0ABR9RUZ4_9ACTN|nr:FAD-dependent oxidoreductase [Nocardioides malaquae]